MLNDLQKVMATMGQIGNAMLAIRADGGFKYRRFIRLSDEELNRLTPQAEGIIMSMVLRLAAAENVIWRWQREAELEQEVKAIAAMLTEKKPAAPKSLIVASALIAGAAVASMAEPPSAINRTQRRHPARKQRSRGAA